MSFEPTFDSGPDARMSVRFWGVRGSVPTPVARNLAHGGNTACLEISLPGTARPDGERPRQSVILDAGTGLCGLGSALQARGEAAEIHLFLTHFHWDHIQGLPFFAPLYDPAAQITFYSMRPPAETEAILAAQMTGPYFPVDFRTLPARLNFVDVSGQSIAFGEAEISNFPLNHPQGCHGYSIRHRGRKLVFASDVEYGHPAFDPILLDAADQADVLVFDAHFTPEEYETHRGWGHSSWRHATSAARLAGAKHLVLFHHDPGHGEAEMQAILEAARAEFSNTSLAIEGETIVI